MKKQYAQRNLRGLDKTGGHYIRHVMAMTAEGLHSKSDIAAELAYRDALNDELLAALQAVMAEHYLGYGLNCEAQVRAAIAKAKGDTA